MLQKQVMFYSFSGFIFYLFIFWCQALASEQGLASTSPTCQLNMKVSAWLRVLHYGYFPNSRLLPALHNTQNFLHGLHKCVFNEF